MPTPQSVGAPLTTCATFVTLTLAGTAAPLLATVRNTLASIPDLTKNVAVRDATSSLTCTVGIGATAWSKLFTGAASLAPPKDLTPFKAIQGATHTAVSTPGDIFLHLRASRRDLIFELEKQILLKLGSAVRVEDTTTGFRYFDGRDLLGFVDGTANPVGAAVAPVVTIQNETDAADVGTAAEGGSFLVVQKYLHDMGGWSGLKAEDQEAVIGRTKLDNVELPDAGAAAQKSHKTLATIDEGGVEYDILRDNMPFGSPASGVYGTYFISYTARLWVVERMLQRMFIGVPEGKHDRILDFSRAVTGCVFFVPSLETLTALGGDD